MSLPGLQCLLVATIMTALGSRDLLLWRRGCIQAVRTCRRADAPGTLASMGLLCVPNTATAGAARSLAENLLRDAPVRDAFSGTFAQWPKRWINRQCTSCSINYYSSKTLSDPSSERLHLCDIRLILLFRKGICSLAKHLYSRSGRTVAHLQSGDDVEENTRSRGFFVWTISLKAPQVFIIAFLQYVGGNEVDKSRQQLGQSRISHTNRAFFSTGNIAKKRMQYSGISNSDESNVVAQLRGATTKPQSKITETNFQAMRRTECQEIPHSQPHADTLTVVKQQYPNPASCTCRPSTLTTPHCTRNPYASRFLPSSL